MKEIQPHYSDKGGHIERPDFHKQLKSHQPDVTIILAKIDMWQIRRAMRRIPRSRK
jgi:hypothetical protein